MKTQLLDIKTPDGICDTLSLIPTMTRPIPQFYSWWRLGLRIIFWYGQEIASGVFCPLPNMFYVSAVPGPWYKIPVKPEDIAGSAVNDALIKIYDTESGVRISGSFWNSYPAKQVRQAHRYLRLLHGGGLAIRAAARYPDRVKLAASFHGAKLATEDPDSPHLLLNQIKAELYIAHAENDQNMTPIKLNACAKP